jgi:hypothetical protein
MNIVDFLRSNIRTRKAARKRYIHLVSTSKVIGGVPHFRNAAARARAKGIHENAAKGDLVMIEVKRSVFVDGSKHPPSILRKVTAAKGVGRPPLQQEAE